MTSDMEQLVRETRRLGRPRKNRRYRGSMSARKRGERLLSTIRETGGISNSSTVRPRDPSRFTPQEAEESKSATLVSDISRLAKKLGDAFVAATQPKDPKVRHYSPFPEAQSDVIRKKRGEQRSARGEKRGRTPTWTETRSEDPSAMRLAYAGIGVFVVLMIGSLSIVAKRDHGAGLQMASKPTPAEAPRITAEPQGQPSLLDEGESPLYIAPAFATTGSGEPE